MTRAKTLTEFARDGYAGKPNNNLPTSPAFYAHALGAYFLSSGRTEPVHVHMGRGYKIHANDMLFVINPNDTFTRIQ